MTIRASTSVWNTVPITPIVRSRLGRSSPILAACFGGCSV